MGAPLLKVENLRTHFFTKRGVIKAVDGVSFSVKERQTMGLVGESACGKSVTCMSILRLEPKPAGRIMGGRVLFNDEDLVLKSSAEMRKIRGRKISIILQDPNTSLNPAYTIGNQVGEVIRLHQQIRGKSVIERVIDALKRCRIPSPDMRVHDYPHMMSGGMRQRVAGAIAISCNPSILIADEPTTALDVTTQAQYLRLLKQVQEETGAAMIFVTHDLGIVARICDTVAVMYMGKIVEKGTVRDIWNKPCHPYTIALMKSIPVLNRKVKRLSAIEGRVPSHFDLPQGCSFAPRCKKAKDRCFEEAPHEEPVSENHSVRCWYV
jgi:oligopeptide/dipeptide ABC transporter ATP-binding protein